MSKRLAVLSLVIFVLIPQAAAQQDQQWWEDGCDPRVLALIEPIESVLDYAAACAEYRQCDPNGRGDFLCQMRSLDVLLRQCPANDSFCEKTALLYAAVLLVFDMPLGESVDWVPPQTVIDGVPAALNAFQQGDYAAALAAYLLTAPEDYPFDSMMPFSRAVVYEALGDVAAALAEYETALEYVFEHPLVWYARSQLYYSIGRANEAAFDVIALQEYASATPQLAGLVAQLLERIPSARQPLQSWLMYPVLTNSSGVAGNFYLDDTLQPPRPVRLQFYEDPAALLLAGASSLYEYEDLGRHWVQVLEFNGETGYHLSYPAYWENSGAMALALFGDVLHGTESISYFEGFSLWQFLIAPEGSLDPRLDLDGVRHCEGSVISRVRSGVRVVNPYWADPGFTYYDTPGGREAGVSSTREMIIIGEPQCVGSITWWQARHDSGVTGWLPENNEEGQYLLNPVAPAALLLFYCPEAPRTRLVAGGSGIVVPGLGPNNLRRQPRLNSEHVGALQPESIFTVVSGPVCADGFAWWQVDYQGIVGWTAEGEGDTYWLAPVENDG